MNNDDRRTQAALSFCAGVSTEALEHGKLADLLHDVGLLTDEANGDIYTDAPEY